MIPSSPCSPSFRRGSLISQLDFEDFLNMDKNSERYVGSDWNHLTREEIRRNSVNSQLSKTLQVVPDLDELYPKETTSSLDIQRDFKDLHLSWPTITVNLASEPNSFNAGLSEKKDDTVPRSPFLPKTSISEIDNLEILSPLFSVTNTSPAIKTPTTLYEICCSSRKSSDDLSIYLPDNFTPASLESLDKSVNRTVFQFPVTAPKQDTINDDVFTIRGEEEKIPSISKIPESRELNGTADDDSEQSSIKHEDNLADNKLIDIALVKEKRAQKKRKHHESRQNREKRQKSLKELENTTIKSENTEKAAESSPMLRNKLERERRSDLNNRFQKLRECIPSLAEKDKASKITILKAATDYANELKREEERSEASLKHEKERNEQLLKSLVNISTNISDQNRHK